MTRRSLPFIFLLTALTLLFTQDATACSACFGKSDSNLAEGMNWGILTLLFVVGCVLTAFAVFFIYLAKREAAMLANVPSESLPDATQKVS